MACSRHMASLFKKKVFLVAEATVQLATSWRNVKSFGTTIDPCRKTW